MRSTSCSGLANLIETVTGLAARQVQFWSLTDAIDTSTAGGEFTFHIFAAFAQMKRRLIPNAPGRLAIRPFPAADAPGRAPGDP